MVRGSATSKMQASVAILVDKRKEEKKQRKAKQLRKACLSCKGNEGYFSWGGSPAKSTYHCDCGETYPALELFDELYVWAIASPIVSR